MECRISDNSMKMESWTSAMEILQASLAKDFQNNNNTNGGNGNHNNDDNLEKPAKKTTSSGK